jgi:uncharacterized membrane protein YdjX (TVP38/TMEM64 family)
MNEILLQIDLFLKTILANMGIYAPLLACFLISIESIIPALPLFVFISINFIYFGKILGFIISWIFTVIGCLFSFFIFRKMELKLNKFNKNHSKLFKFTDYFGKLTIPQITLILAVPFTPAFAVNIVAGLSKMNVKKYLICLLIGKIFLVYFWGFVGTSLIESLRSPVIIFKIIIMLLISYGLSYIVNKTYELNKLK